MQHETSVKEKSAQLENSDSIAKVPEDAGPWKLTVFSDKWWADSAPVKSFVNTK